MTQAITDIGQYIESIVFVANAVALTTGAQTTITTLTLPKAFNGMPVDEWDVDGLVSFHPAATTTINYTACGVSLLNNGYDPPYASGYLLGEVDNQNGVTSNLDLSQLCLTRRVQITNATSPVTVYLIANSGFGASTMSAYGWLRARRVLN